MTQGTVSATLNFAGTHKDGGIWSNLTPEIRTQQLKPQTVEIQDARELPMPATLDAEGFCVIDLPFSQTAWHDAEWIGETYVPACLAAVQQLTKADRVAALHAGVLIRDTGNSNAAPAADFVHLDHTRQSALPFLNAAFDDETRKRFSHVRTFNVWRAISPPPQNVPLALCDQRSHSSSGWVTGLTVEPTFPDGVPYVSCVSDPAQRWYYFSNLHENETIVFKGYDSDPNAPFGCFHGAFSHPGIAAGYVPRASVEMRVFALSQA